MTNPSLSIIIPSYKSPHLSKVINSLRGIGALEIIVVDSSPEKPDIADEDITLVWLPRRTPAGAARNIGAARASGEYLIFVDSDVVFLERSQSAIIEAIQRKTKSVVCGHYISNRKNDPFFPLLQNLILDYRMTRKTSSNSDDWWASSHFLMLRKSFEEVGGFNNSIETYEDVEFFSRCRNLGIKFEITHDFEAIHHKNYDFKGFLADYYHKAFNSFQVRRRYPKVFKGSSAKLGPAIILTWAAGTLVPFWAVLLAVAPASLAPAMAIALLLLLASPMVLWPAMLKEQPLTYKLRMMAVWPFLGMSVAAAISRSALAWHSKRALEAVLSLLDLFRAFLSAVARTGSPIQIIHFITARCNLRCVHCFYKEELDAKNPGEMSLKGVDKTTREIGPVLWYSLAGGEPILRKDLVELTGIIQSNCRPHVFSLPTNGWYVEKTFKAVQEILQRHERMNFLVFISLDGPQQVHDAIRGEGSFERAKQTMERLRPLQKFYPNLYLNVTITVMPDNYEVSPAFIKEIADDFRPSAISINLFRYHSPEHPPVPVEVIDGYRRTVKAYEEILNDLSSKDYGFFAGKLLKAKEILQKELIYRVAKNNQFITPCTAGTLSYIIFEDGRVQPCEVLDDSIGVLSEDDKSPSFKEMIKSPKAQKLRKWIKDSKCMCTYECAMSTNVLFTWPLTLRLLGRVAKDLFK